MTRTSAKPPAKRIPLVVLLTAALILCAYLGSQFVTYERWIITNGDMRQYESVALSIAESRSGKPVKITNQYPPLSSVIFYGAYNNPFDLPFHRGLLLMTILFAVLAISFVLGFLDVRDLRWPLVAVPLSIALLEPAVFFARFDFFPMLAILLTWLCLRREKYGLAAGFLVAGILVKFSPVFLVPLLFVCTPTLRRKELYRGALLSFAGLSVLIASVLGIRGTWETLRAFITLRASHPVYVFSTVSSVDMFARMTRGARAYIEWMDPNLGHFNMDFPTFTPVVLLLLTVVGSCWIAHIAGRDKHRTDNIALYISAVMFWVLASTPLLTMHYYLWILPVALAWFLERTEMLRRIRPWQFAVGLLTVIVALLGQYMYPTAYFDLVDYQTPLAVSANLLRNILTLGLVIALLKAAKEHANVRKS